VYQGFSQPKALYTLDIFARDIAIKRYFNKKIILSHGCLKAKVTTNQGTLCLIKSLPWFKYDLIFATSWPQISAHFINVQK